MIPAGRVDELRIDADLVPRFLNAAFENVLHIQFIPQLFDIRCFSFVLKNGRAGRYGQVPELGQVGNDILGKTIAEIFLIDIIA